MYIDLTGRRFGRLLVLENVGSAGKGHGILWRCKCDCGNMCEISSHVLLTYNKNSCGCLRTESNKQRIGGARKNIEEYNVQDTNILKLKQKKSKNNKSGVKGVCYDNFAGKYKAYINFKKKRYYLGYFVDLAAATQARNIAEKEIYGNFLVWYQETYPEQWKKMKKKEKSTIET